MTGCIEIRCGDCDTVVPAENVDVDTAIAVCRECGAVRRLADLMRVPIPADSRYTYKIQGNTITVRKEATWDFFPMMLLGAGFCLMELLLFMLLGLSTGIGIAGICILLFSTWLAFDRRTVCITPDTCRLTWNPFFLPFTKEIPRNDVYRVVRKSSWIGVRNTIRLYYRGGSIALEAVAPNGDSCLLGALNHYLYTVPPTDPVARGVWVYFGGSKSKTQKVKSYCPDCGSLIDAKNLDLASQHGTCGECGCEFPLAESRVIAYPEADWPMSRHLNYEKKDGRLRIGWCPGLSRKILEPLLWIVCLACGVVFALDIAMPLQLLWKTYWMMILLFTISHIFYLPRNMTQWTIDFDMERLEISYKCWFFGETQTIPCGKIAAFSLHEEKKRRITGLNHWLCPQSAVIAERNDSLPPLRMPGLPDQPSALQSTWLLNELNDFLASKGGQKGRRDNRQHGSLFESNWIPPSRKWESGQ